MPSSATYSEPPSAISPAVREILTRVQAYAVSKRVTMFLVGGMLRDQLLGRGTPIRNLDLAVPAKALTRAEQLADTLSGSFVLLDEAEETARVVVMHEGEQITLDLSTFRADTIEADLQCRDLTINAMAIRLVDWLQHPEIPQPLIDPLGGARDLAQRRLIACRPSSFDEDPLRILRAVRLAAQLGFGFDDRLPQLMTEAAEGLRHISGERVRDELLATFETDAAGNAMATLEQLGALEVLFPELGAGRGMVQGGVHHLDVLEHQLETVRQADRMLKDFSEFSAALRAPLAAYCAEHVTGDRSRKSLIKLGGLLHDVGKPANRRVHDDGEIWFIGHEHTGAELVRPIAQRLRLANREVELVTQLVRHHLRPGFLSREPELTRRAIYRFYKDLGEDGPACLLGWWNDRMATRGPVSRLDELDQQRARLEELLRPYFFKVEEIVRPPRLMNGHQLMRTLGVPPGPLVGELLAAIEEAQAEGRVRSSDEALALARAHLAQRPR